MNWIRFVMGIMVVGFVVTAAPELRAQESEETALKSGESVRRKILYRSTRFEVAPTVGVTVGDAYIHNGVVGANISYYLTNSIGLGLIGGFSPLHTETDLAKNVKVALEENNQAAFESLTFSYLQWFAGFEAKYAPIFGKFSLFNGASVGYDLHLVGGAALVMRQACNAGELDESCAYSDGEPVEGLAGPRPAATFGAGLRIFASDAFALNLQIRDMLYRRGLVVTESGERDAEFGNNVYLSISGSFFFPQTVKISR